MEDLQNTSTEGTQTSTEGKTFTQEDVNRIVQERLAKERSKTAGNGDDELSKRAAELDMRERKLNAREALKKEGLPDYLVDALNMNTDEDFQKSMEAIKKLKGESPAIVASLSEKLTLSGKSLKTTAGTIRYEMHLGLNRCKLWLFS